MDLIAGTSALPFTIIVATVCGLQVRAQNEFQTLAPGSLTGYACRRLQPQTSPSQLPMISHTLMPRPISPLCSHPLKQNREKFTSIDSTIPKQHYQYTREERTYTSTHHCRSSKGAHPNYISTTHQTSKGAHTLSSASHNSQSTSDPVHRSHNHDSIPSVINHP